MKTEQKGIRLRLGSERPGKAYVSVLLLFVLQPLMDILSYWMQELSLSNVPTLALRFLVLAIVVLTGFLLSENKRCYYLFAGICALLLLGHGAACLVAGYAAPIPDVINFIRVAQMPAFAICFITLLKKKPGLADAFEYGFILNFWVISVSVLLSVLTGTSSATYQVSGYGILGWFATSNAQSAVMSVLTPIAILLAFRKKNLLYFAVTVVAGFAQLFFLGPRLAFLTILITTVGLLLTMLLTRDFRRTYAAVIVLAMAACLACYHYAPMYLNQTSHNDEMAQKQVWEEEMFERERAAAADQAAESSAEMTTENNDPEAERKAMAFIYEYYTPLLCERFGTERVMAAYNYSRDVNVLMATRPQKILYCKLLLGELPITSRLFGMEIASMTFHDFNFDVENDFHGVLFLLGIVGLLLMVGFLLYFVCMIVRCLVRDFRGYFTVTSAAFGMAFLLLLTYAYCTAGVLRRPNSSFYMSAVLAMIYQLVKLRKPEGTAAEGCK